MALGVKTTAEDVRSLVRYLAERPTGVDLPSLKEDAARLADARKLAAFGAWGIVTRQEGKLRLTSLGRNLAQQPDDDAQGFAAIIGDNPPYERALAWAQERGMAHITANEVASYWFDHHPDAVGGAGDETLRDQAVAFFSLAEAAGLGRLVVGRSGKPTRLELRPDATAYIPPASLLIAPDPAPSESDDPPVPAPRPREYAPPEPVPAHPPAPPAPEHSSLKKTFYIDTAGDEALASQLETILRFGGYEIEVAGNEFLTRMRTCAGGVLVIPAESGEEQWLKLGAAAALFQERLVLLVPAGVRVPEFLAETLMIRLDSGSLDWGSGVRLMEYLADRH